MTRHNLEDHISWLLSVNHKPLVGRPGTATSHTNRNSAAALIETYSFEEEAEEEIPRVPINFQRNRPATVEINVVSEFRRPLLPSSVTSEPHVRELIDSNIEVVQMGKLSSAQRSSRPALYSQHQLATPASTSTSSVAPPKGSLTQSYSDLLRTKSATPTLKTPIERSRTKSSRQLPTPRTPQHNPHLDVKFETVESVDLTGDDHEQRSSSSEIPQWGEPKLLWNEESAVRTEPLAKSKKRKSDEISKRTPRRRRQDVIPAKTDKRDRSESFDSDGFMDIDEQMLSQLEKTSAQESQGRKLYPTIEQSGLGQDFEYHITETKSRIETHTRISRGPSVSKSKTKPTRSTERTLMESMTTSGSQTPKPQSKVQVEASPLSKKTESPRSPGQLSSERPNRCSIRTIKDSDDDEVMSDIESKVNCSPRTRVKRSPRILDGSKTWQDVSQFKQSGQEMMNFNESKSRVGSPLRPISQNVNAGQEKISSPSRLDLSQKPAPILKSPIQKSSQQTSSSGITIDDRALLKFYLKYPSALISYHDRIAQVLRDNAAAVMEYIDKGEPAPVPMKAEREILLDQKKAYDALAVVGEKYRTLINDKKKLHHEITELMNEDADTTSADERMTSLGPQIRDLEKELVQLLHVSGAVNDGFGTGPISTKPQVHPPGSKLQEAPLVQSSIGSAQVVFQTQFPSLPPVSSTNSDMHRPDQPIQLLSHGSRVNQESSRASYQASPSPRRQEITKPFGDAQHSRVSTNKPMRQPNFYSEPSPVNYGSDDEIFDDLLAEELELHRNGGPTRDQERDDVEEDYGDFDDVDFLEVTQDFESRQHPQRLASRSSPKTLAMDNPRSLSNSGTRDSRSRADVGKKTMYSTMDPAHASMMKHPWSSDVSKALKDRFRLRGFRQNQLEAINATLGGKDAFILMPTGGGKSLCYQLPAVVQSGKTKGVTIVISPLLSLMSDQVDHLKKRNIQAFLVTGETSPDERNVVFGALNNPLPEQFIQLLYVTPEMVGKSGKLSSTLTQLHKNRRLARIVIDEAHCVSQWGHDFRPDYKSLDSVRRKYPGVPFIALTATATENVKADCIHNLGMDGCEEYKQSFNRPNLHYEVRSKKGKGVGAEVLDSMKRLILVDYANQTGIIYTLSRKGCEDLASKLQEHGISAHHFHASMEPEQKRQVQRDWQAGKYQVVVATIAFGMGIDKPDVRFVIHHTIPKSLEGYYQETGRAGRDGKPSGCYLYYGYQDTAVLQRFIEDSEGTEEVKERQREMLKRMVQFCEERSDCRRANILAYFGEAFNKEDCGKMCDNCTSDAQFESKDVTRQVQAAIKIVKALKDENVTLLHVVDILRGSQSTKLINQGRQELDGYGEASNLPRHEVERMFIRLLMDRVVEEYSVILRGGFPQQYITLGPNYRDFEKGRRKIKLLIQVSESTKGVGNMSKRTGNNAEDTDKRRRARALPTSTMLTSPLAPSSHKFNQFQGNKGLNYDDDSSSDEAFAPPRQSIARQKQPRKVLGPPITTDDRMKKLPDLHRIFVHDFVVAAKKKEEHIRNKRGLSSAWFTESDFRAMAINWTTTTKEMLCIPGINPDNVQRWGEKFVGLVKDFYQNYKNSLEPGDEELRGGPEDDEDMDGNHKTVIDLVSEQEDTDNEYGESDDDTSQAAMPSKYFNPEVAEFNARVAEEQLKPKPRRPKQASPGKAYRGGSSSRGKFRGGKKFGGRRSGGSASGSATGSSRSFSGSGVAKRGQSRRGSGMSRKASSSRGGAARDGNLMRAFGNSGGIGSGGIGMMPT